MIRRPKVANDEHEEKKGVTRKAWRHPFRRTIEVPYRSAAAIAVMEMGVHDYQVIGDAVGLTPDEVKEIDLSKDQPIRELGSEGIPYGEYFHLEKEIRCPKCSARVTVAPCIACNSPEKYRLARERGQI